MTSRLNKISLEVNNEIVELNFGNDIRADFQDLLTLFKYSRNISYCIDYQTISTDVCAIELRGKQITFTVFGNKLDKINLHTEFNGKNETIKLSDIYLLALMNKIGNRAKKEYVVLYNNLVLKIHKHLIYTYAVIEYK